MMEDNLTIEEVYSRILSGEMTFDEFEQWVYDRDSYIMEESI